MAPSSAALRSQFEVPIHIGLPRSSAERYHQPAVYENLGDYMHWMTPRSGLQIEFVEELGSLLTQHPLLPSLFLLDSGQRTQNLVQDCPYRLLLGAHTEAGLLRELWKGGLKENP